MSVRILHGNCLDILPTLAEASVDSVVTDPPYELGFMGKKWDKSGVAFRAETWEAIYRVMKPGAHLLAFGGTRTSHRMVCAIEDAGFEIRDQVLWLYGSGFPKSLDVSKAIDKAAGAERNVVGSYRVSRDMRDLSGGGYADQERGGSKQRDIDITAPATPEAAQWTGWGTALKPACEPIVLARKPLVTPSVNVLDIVESQLRIRGVVGEIRWVSGYVNDAAGPSRTASSVLTERSAQSGTSARSADVNGTQTIARRSPICSERGGTLGQREIPAGPRNTVAPQTGGLGQKCSKPTADTANAAGRKNSHSSHLTTSTAAETSTEGKSARSTPFYGEKAFPPVIECFAGIVTGLTGSLAHAHILKLADGSFVWPDDLPRAIAAQKLSVAANVLKHGVGGINIDACRIEGWSDADLANMAVSSRGTNSTSNVKFGFEGSDDALKANAVGRWPANVAHDGSDEVLEAFAAYGERAAGSFPKTQNAKSWKMSSAGKGLSAARGMEDTGTAARFFYSAKATAEDRMGSKHPTIKPLALMDWLVKLITPPGGTVLDPFAGSGTTLLAADRLQMNAIGIDMEASHVEDIRRRFTLDAPLFAEVNV